MLTAEQKLHFESFGFLVIRGYFSADEMAEITREFDDGLTRDRQGQPFDGKKRQGVFALVETRMLWLLEDDRIYEPIEQLLGPGFVWIGSDRESSPETSRPRIKSLVAKLVALGFK